MRILWKTNRKSFEEIGKGIKLKIKCFCFKTLPFKNQASDENLQNSKKIAIYTQYITNFFSSMILTLCTFPQQKILTDEDVRLKVFENIGIYY